MQNKQEINHNWATEILKLFCYYRIPSLYWLIWPHLDCTSLLLGQGKHSGKFTVLSFIQIVFNENPPYERRYALGYKNRRSELLSSWCFLLAKFISYSKNVSGMHYVGGCHNPNLLRATTLCSPYHSVQARSIIMTPLFRPQYILSQYFNQRYTDMNGFLLRKQFWRFH